MGLLRKRNILEQKNSLVRVFPTRSIFDVVLGGGIPNGITVITGAPGSGKSSFALQMASLLAKYYNFDAIYLDTEHSLSFERVKTLFSYYAPDKIENLEVVSKATVEELAEELNERLMELYKFQVSQKKDLIGFVADHFDEYKAIFIWDSIATVQSKTVQAKITEKLKKGDDLNKIAIAETARILATIFTNIVLSYSNYALPFLVITHMKNKIDLNPYAGNDLVIKGLEGKALKGGMTPLYLAHNILVLNAGKRIDENTIWVKFKIAKSRLTSPKEFEIVFNYQYGYREDINLFYFLKKHGFIKTTGGYYKFDGDDHRYRKDKAIEIINKDIEKYRDLFYNEILPKEYKINNEDIEVENDLLEGIE